MSKGLLDAVRERRDAKQNELTQLVAKVEREKRTRLTDTESAQFEELRSTIEALDERATELAENVRREANAIEARRVTGMTRADGRMAAYANVRGSDVYTDAPGGPSFFRDLAATQLRTADSYQAAERLQRNQAERMEMRAGDLASNVAGSGADFAPPLWLIDDFVSFARPGRVTADLMNGQPLPGGVSSINLPRVKSGTTVAPQAVQNTNVSDTPAQTDSVSSGIATISGKQVSSQQLLDQSPGFDRVLLADLAAAWAQQIGAQVLYGTNANGQLRGLVGVAVVNTYTAATPALTATSGPSLLTSVLNAGAAVQTAIFKPADAIVMHPNRWAWILGQVDSTGRPLVPSSGGFNPAGTVGAPTAEGAAGTLAGYNVWLDPNISLTANGSSGSGTSQDEIYLFNRSELWLYESEISLRTFDATYADELAVLFRVHSYAASIPHRRTGAVQVIRGTGLVHS